MNDSKESNTIMKLLLVNFCCFLSYSILVYLSMGFKYGRTAGIEPASSPWQREILPFDYIRIPDTHIHVHTYMTYLIYHICVWILFVQD